MRFTSEILGSTGFFLDNYDYAKREFESCYNCISYCADLADHYGNGEFAAQIRRDFNKIIGAGE